MQIVMHYNAKNNILEFKKNKFAIIKKNGNK